MSVRTTLYGMVGVDARSWIDQVVDRSDPDWFEQLADLTDPDGKGFRKGQLVLLESPHGDARPIRIGILLADPVTDRDPGWFSLELTPKDLEEAIRTCQEKIRERFPQISLDQTPSLRVFHLCS